MIWTAFGPFWSSAQTDPRWRLIGPGLVAVPLADLQTAAAFRVVRDDQVRGLAKESGLHLAFEQRQRELIRGQWDEIERLHETVDMADHTIAAREAEAQAWKNSANAAKNSLWWKIPLAWLVGYGIAKL